MSKAAVDQVIRKAIGDAAFRAKLHSDPGSALAGFDLTKDERSAITSGDPKRLTALGVDQRMSKAFDLGGQTGAVSKVISPELAGGIAASAVVDEGGINAMNLRRIEGDLNVSAARTPADTAGDFNRLDEGHISASNLRRVEGDLNVSAARTPADVSGDFNRLDEGQISGTTAAREAGSSMNASNLRRIEGDLNVSAARQSDAVAGDFNRLDEGTVGGTASKFETTLDPRSDGFLAKELDAGLVANTDATDAASTESTQTPDSGLDQGSHNVSE